MLTLPKLRKEDNEDGRMVRGIALGLPNVLDELYVRYYPLVERFVCKNSGTPDDARDVFQDVLMAVYYNVQEEDFQLTCRFETYLYSVCRNLWFKELRNRKIHPMEFRDEIMQVDDDELEDSRQRLERYKLYRQYFDKIGDKCQQLLKLYMQGLDMKSIASRLGFASTTYARKRKFLCKEKLVGMIKSDEQFQNLLSFE